MHKRIASKVTIDERNTRPDRLQRKPKHEILRTIRTINGDRLATLHPEIVNQPIPSPLDIVVELPVCPRPTLELQEQIRRLGTECVVFDEVVDSQSFLFVLLGNELQCFGSSIV